MIKIESDKQFSIAQRTKGRPGCMLGIDKKNQKLEERIEKKSIDAIKRKKRAYEEMGNLGNLFFFDDLCLFLIH